MDPPRLPDSPSWGSRNGAAGCGGGGSEGSGNRGGASHPSGGSVPPTSPRPPASLQPPLSPSSLPLPPANRRCSVGESSSTGAGGGGGGSGGSGGVGGVGVSHPPGCVAEADGGEGARGSLSGGGDAGRGGVVGATGSVDGGGVDGGGGGWRMPRPPPVLRGGLIPSGAGGSGNGPANGFHSGLGAPGIALVPGLGRNGGVGGSGGGDDVLRGRNQLQPPHLRSLPPLSVAPQQGLYPYVDDQGDGVSLRMPGSGVPASVGFASGALASASQAQPLAAPMSYIGLFQGDGRAGGQGQTGRMGPGRLAVGGGGGVGPIPGEGAYPPTTTGPGASSIVGGGQIQEGIRYPGQAQADDVPPLGIGYHFGGQPMPQGFLASHGGGPGGGAAGGAAGAGSGRYMQSSYAPAPGPPDYGSMNGGTGYYGGASGGSGGGSDMDDRGRDEGGHGKAVAPKLPGTSAVRHGGQALGSGKLPAAGGGGPGGVGPGGPDGFSPHHGLPPGMHRHRDFEAGGMGDRGGPHGGRSHPLGGGGGHGGGGGISGVAGGGAPFVPQFPPPMHPGVGVQGGTGGIGGDVHGLPSSFLDGSSTLGVERRFFNAGRRCMRMACWIAGSVGTLLTRCTGHALLTELRLTAASFVTLIFLV